LPFRDEDEEEDEDEDEEEGLGDRAPALLPRLSPFFLPRPPAAFPRREEVEEEPNNPFCDLSEPPFNAQNMT
jgi:hypothetical protein